MIKKVKYFFLVSAICTLLTIAIVRAETQNQLSQDPYQLVQQTTSQVIELIKSAKVYYEKEPERFNKQVAIILEGVIDFDTFARGVMGSYASERRINSLASDVEKAAVRAQIQHFSASFKDGLVNTYASSLMEFNGEKISTLPPRKGDDATTGSVAVIQHIFNNAGKPYVIQYSMRRNNKGEWKLNNLIIEGINLGLTYRNQFAESAELYKGDLDQVIAHWKVEPQTLNANNVNDGAKQ